MSYSPTDSMKLTRMRNRTIDNKLIRISADGSSEEVVELSITTHAKLRWLQRTHNFTASPADVWERATPIALESANFGEARYDEHTETILCVNEATLVTILSAEYENFTVSTDKKESRCDICGSMNSGADTGSCQMKICSNR